MFTLNNTPQRGEKGGRKIQSGNVLEEKPKDFCDRSTLSKQQGESKGKSDNGKAGEKIPQKLLNENSLKAAYTY